MAVTQFRPSPRDPRHFVRDYDNVGEFVRLPKRDLRIDMSYQRQVNQRAVIRIANAWSWVACGCLAVSHRPDGTMYILDGGHRWNAANLLPEIRELPCMVFELPDAAAEAVGFLGANVERRSIGRMAAHKAELLTGSPRALLVDELAREAGRTVGPPSDATHLSCVSAVERCAAHDATALRRIWPIVVEICRGRPMPSNILVAIWAAERRMPYGQSLSDERWRIRLLRAGPVNLERDIRGAVALAGNRNERSLAYGVTTAINHALRAGKLELNERVVQGSFKV